MITGRKLSRLNVRFSVPAYMLILLLAATSCNFNKGRQASHLPDDRLRGALNLRNNLPFDSSLVTSFYRSFPELDRYRQEVLEVYSLHKYTHIWYDEGGVIEFGQTLYTRAGEMNADGVSSAFPYQEKLDDIFQNEKENTLSQVETELMLTNLYLFYAEKVFKGLDDSTTTAIGWLLPRKQVAYPALLDSVLSDNRLLDRNDSVLFSQYYKLRDMLQRYREIEKKGGWSASATMYPELMHDTNVPVGDRIRQIIVNMERCRWISPEFASAKEYIVVNIPSFTLNFVRDGKSEFETPVIVGAKMTKTVIFSGMLSYIVFSPYWVLPPSIINTEVKPGMANDKNYLEKHNMEWNDGQVRQKPGKNNSLGLVKFIFPNSDDIYMHDSPAKSLFARESRAFSHGCIRVGKPRDLAVSILKDDREWTPEKIGVAMHAGKESTCLLKNKIPVYIGYFTAWVDAEGRINFYDDIYQRDKRLMQLLMDDQ